jgi:hypothetical protein
MILLYVCCFSFSLLELLHVFVSFKLLCTTSIPVHFNVARAPLRHSADA